ncbi:bacteriocin immunity protein [Salmonella enterica subsp. salamae]|nr:bacteriocin immunity protein [Salmonella enterica]ECF5992106.1 bacteriocin immunity protein [Salmonella enterica subsp. salamae]ECG1596577.1 bacteriocin immunity protein [Salmonella enterica subsp. salamae]ECH1406532.1 bacteriocin immunity protein [Salmonella enterica subsp. salamae]ECI5038787.1 bacteriocin immunity protein [Salmonella enterica subsp. salamae]
MFNFKENVADYTEKEFIELLDEFRTSTRKDKLLDGDELEDYIDRLTDHFTEITGHPAQGDLIFYPESVEARAPENILKIVKEWRRSQGLPLFKDSE